MPPTLQQIDEEVDALTGNMFRFRDALTHIEQASQSNVNTGALSDILSRLRNKIPDLIDFNRIRADAQDLAEALTFDDVDARIEKIKSRNDLLTDLNDSLQTQVEQANSDANLVNRIKEGVQRATKTVQELQDLVHDLSDSSTKDRIAALIERLGNISAILHPENA